MSKKLLLLTHNGLGDGITSIGAIRFLSTIYDSIHYICKSRNVDNIKWIMHDIPNLTLIPFDEKQEASETSKIVSQKRSENFDILTCGVHSFHGNKITNEKLISRKIDNKHYKMDQRYFSSKTGNLDPHANVLFIGDFYHQMNLDLSIYYEWFDIKQTEKSKKMHDMISDLNVIFLHTKASDSEIKLNSIINKFINLENYILICANKNLYLNGPKKQLAQKFVDIPIIDYITTFVNAKEIHIIDSCFTAMALPMMKTNKLKASTIKIYDRVR